MTFPLFHTPGTIVFLDDDPDYLEMLALVLPREWNVELFLRPSDCVARLQAEPPQWEADAWAQQQIIDRWRQGAALIPQILRYWDRSTARYDLTRVLVVDYSMPAMDGLQVLDGIVDWPGSRVLLTGQADEQIAVNAFNRGLIDQFLAKQSPDISRRLVDALHRLMATGSERQSRMWRATLTPGQLAQLRNIDVANDIQHVAQRWVEHAVIGEPFGILGQEANGTTSWLQLEPTDRLDELAELCETAGMPAHEVVDVRSGRKLAALELAQSLGDRRPTQLGVAFGLGQGRDLVGALFTLDPAFTPDPAHSYARWLASRPPRQVLD
ncbi:MAG: response regulator [Burkholderiaceae bacterium]|nr:response regulator [Burkholderiaceae bacterium]